MTIQPGLPRYRDDGDYPPLVVRAVEAARALEFEKACTPEVGALLRVLAAGATRIGETGTACGVGAAWLAAGMREHASLVTVEIDPTLAAAAADVLAADPRVRVLAGDAKTALEDHAPFDILFTDGGLTKDGPGPILDLVSTGGLVVMDDLTPEDQWPDELRAKYPNGDPMRLAWADAAADTVELMVTPTESVMLAVKR